MVIPAARRAPPKIAGAQILRVLQKGIDLQRDGQFEASEGG